MPLSALVPFNLDTTASLWDASVCPGPGREGGLEPGKRVCHLRVNFLWKEDVACPPKQAPSRTCHPEPPPSTAAPHASCTPAPPHHLTFTEPGAFLAPALAPIHSSPGVPSVLGTLPEDPIHPLRPSFHITSVVKHFQIPN